MRYKFERKDKEANAEWEEVTKDDMLSALRNAYIDPDIIVHAMIDGLEAQTPFAKYRAVKK